MYSSKVLAHLADPQNVGEVSAPTVRGESNNPVCGDRLTLTLRLDGGVIVEARFLVEGCPPSIAAGSVLTGMLIGISAADAGRLTPRQVTDALESLPRNKEHCAVLAIDALRMALRGLDSGVASDDRFRDKA